ncbi:MAG TPA: TlpA disulfide reductase family protein [Thermoanaerobaculia bacterium]|nr:TlpA disulfide reductase family protein [Thermoanaerobaculia bacterium]
MNMYPRLSSRSVLTAAFVSSLLLFGCREGATAGAASPGGPPAPGAKVAFQLQTLEGRPMGPKDFPGQVVVVDFWATWCGPCHIQALILEDVYKDYHGKGVQFLAANVGEETEAVRRFVKEKPFSYPVLIDPKDVAGQLGIEALPTLMVIDKKGKLSFFEAGLTDGDTLRRILHQAGA